MRFFAIAVSATMMFTSSAFGVLQHQYTFNDGNADDSVGTAHGTVVDPMGIGFFAGGQYNMTANNGIGSGALDPGAATPNGTYIDLPQGSNGLFTAALQSGQSNAASFEMWVTVETNRTWARIFDFGTSDGGEGFATGGANQDYVFSSPVASPGQGIPANSFAVSTHAPGDGGDSPETFVGIPSAAPVALPTGIEHHIVFTWDQMDTSAGCPTNHVPCNDGTVPPGGTTNVYLNNVLAATGPMNPDLLLGELFNENNDYLGRSQYNDPLFDGTFNEFRIYDHVVTAEEVNSSFVAGPVPAPVPTIVVDRDSGDVIIENQSGGGQQLASYAITSAAGGLNVAASWDPIAPDSGWTVVTQTPTEVAEEGGTAVTLDPGGSIAIGDAWIPSIFEDLQFEFEFAGGTTGLGAVQFIGNDGVPFSRSDLNTDGQLNVDDWVTFLAGNATDLSALSQAQAYRMGDLNNDNMNNHADFLLFQADYIAANGAAAFAALAAVPEPSTLALLALAGLGVLGIRSPQRRSMSVSKPIVQLGFFLATALAVLTAASESRADLKHRYSFTSDISDSVGGMNGTLVDAGTTPNATFTGGVLDMSTNPNEGSNAIVEGAYVDLPNGIVSGAVNSDQVGAISFEWWATVTTQRTWQRFGDFGTSNNGEDTAASGDASEYVLVTPNSGRFGNGLEITNHPASNTADPLVTMGNMAEPNVGLAGPFPLNTEAHVVAVYDHTDPTLHPNGTMSMYYNGALIGQNAMHADVDLRTFTNDNNWLGRSQWNDAIFAGNFNEFRIYDHALDANAVVFNAVLGPEVALPPQDLFSVIVNTATGRITLANNVDVPLDLNYYEITSPGGALSSTGWNSLDDQEGGDDPGIGWDESGGASANQLIELFLAEGGFTLGAMAELNLGNAFNTSVFGPGVDGDLAFQFGLDGGALVAGGVIYDDTPGAAVLGDYNEDGVVNAADYTVWRNNEGGDGSLLPNRNPGITGPIGQGDYNFWVSRFGETSGAGSAIPEPASLLLVIILMLGLSSRSFSLHQI